MSLHKKMVAIVGGAIAVAAQSAHAQAQPPAGTPPTLYVAPTGGYYNWDRNTESLNNPNKPYDTITHACQHALPNDTIIVKAGTYTDAANIDGNAYLTIQPATGATVVLKGSSSNSYAIVKIDGADHILFQGFEINGVGSGPDANGVVITPGTSRAGTYKGSDHIQIKNCKVHDAGGGGICSNADGTNTVGCDYITIVGNEIYNCLKTGQYRGSGISLHEDRNSNPSDTSWHSVIDSNKVHDNVNQYPNTASNPNPDLNYHSDGNGIIIDTTQHGAAGGPVILVQNNVVYRNGGRGIEVLQSDNVTVLNNTVYQNDTDPYLQFGGGELAVAATNNVLFSNNMVQGNGKAPAFVVSEFPGSPNGPNIHFINNTFGGAGVSIPAANIDWNTTLYFDWATVFPFVNAAAGDFHLRALGAGNDVALNKGSSAAGQYSWYSIDGVERKPASPATPPGGAVDRGAYEQSCDVIVTRGGYRYQRSNGHVFQTVTLTAVGGNAEGPISLILDNLIGASLVSRAGVTSATSPAGSPYVNTPGLTSGTSTTVFLEFTAQPSSYATRTVIGSASR